MERRIEATLKHALALGSSGLGVDLWWVRAWVRGCVRAWVRGWMRGWMRGCAWRGWRTCERVV